MKLLLDLFFISFVVFASFIACFIGGALIGGICAGIAAGWEKIRGKTKV